MKKQEKGYYCTKMPHIVLLEHFQYLFSKIPTTSLYSMFAYTCRDANSVKVIERASTLNAGSRLLDVFIETNRDLVSKNTGVSLHDVKAVYTGWIDDGLNPNGQLSATSQAEANTIIQKVYNEYFRLATDDFRKQYTEYCDEVKAIEKRRSEAEKIALEKAKKEAADREAMRQKAIDELEKAKKEFEAAEVAAKKQLEEFNTISSSLDSLKALKTAADQAATTQAQALNVVINNLNAKKAGSVTLAKVMLLKAAPGSTVADAPTFLNITFTANSDPVYKTAQAEGKKHCDTLNGLKLKVSSSRQTDLASQFIFTALHGADIPNKQDLINKKTEAQALGAKIKAQKDLLDQAALALKSGKTHADTKAQEYSNDIAAKQTLIALEQQKIDIEIQNINTQILNGLNTQDANGETPLIKACKQNNMDAFDYIFQASNATYARNIIFDIKDLSGKTALHYLVAQGLQTEARLFLEKGANPYVPDDEGYTSHMLAVSSGHAQLAAEIVRKFGQPELTPELRTKVFAAPEILNAQDESGDSLLTKACKGGKVAVIKYILKFGISNLALDLQNLSGQTALHILIEQNMIPEAKLLLERGANPYIEDAGAHSAYSQALATGAMQELCALMIQKFGPTPNMNQAEHKDDDVESTFSDLGDLGDKLLGLGLAGNVEHHDDVF